MATTPYQNLNQLNNSRNSLILLNNNSTTGNKFQNAFNTFNINLEETISLQEEVKRFELQRNMKCKKRKEKIENFGKQLTNYKQLKIKFKSELEEEELNLKALINNKEQTYEKLKRNSIDLMNETNFLQNTMENNKYNHNLLVTKKRENLESKLKEKIVSMKEITREIKKIKELEREDLERKLMLNEEIDRCKIDVINLTSKMESIIEYIDNINKMNNSFVFKSISNLVEVSLLEFKFIDKDKFSSYLFDKLTSVNLKLKINRRNFKLNFKEIFSLKKHSGKTISEIIKYLFAEISNYISPEILDIEMLIKSNIKLLYFEFENEIRMEFLNYNKANSDSNKLIKLTQNLHNLNNYTHNHYQKEMQIQINNLNKKKEKRNNLKRKINQIKNEELEYQQEEEEMKNNIITIENDILSIQNLQEALREEVRIIEEEHNNLKLKYDEEFNYIKNKKAEIKKKLEKEKIKLEKSNQKFECEVESIKKQIFEHNAVIKSIINAKEDNNNNDNNFYNNINTNKSMNLYNDNFKNAKDINNVNMNNSNINFKSCMNMNSGNKNKTMNTNNTNISYNIKNNNDNNYNNDNNEHINNQSNNYEHIVTNNESHDNLNNQNENSHSKNHKEKIYKFSSSFNGANEKISNKEKYKDKDKYFLIEKQIDDEEVIFAEKLLSNKLEQLSLQENKNQNFGFNKTVSNFKLNMFNNNKYNQNSNNIRNLNFNQNFNANSNFDTNSNFNTNSNFSKGASPLIKNSKFLKNESDQIEQTKMKIHNIKNLPQTELTPKIKTTSKIKSTPQKINSPLISQNFKNTPENKSKINSKINSKIYSKFNSINSTLQTKPTTNTTQPLRINNLVYNPKFTSKPELLLIEKFKPLLEGSIIHKRNFLILNKKVALTQEYSPIDFPNRKQIPPVDFNFKKYFLCLDKSLNKLIFNKIKEEDKTNELNLSSISKMVVPNITKDIIFVKQVYKKLEKKKILDINTYIENNIEKLIEVYSKGFKYKSDSNVGVDDKLFNEDYRELLLESNKFIFYIYLKPDNETRLELIFYDYDDFKHWINGMEDIMRNDEVKEVIRKKIV